MTINYFTPSETSCKCGCGYDINPATRALANQVREEWGGPLIVASGARCALHNKAEGGAKRSAHIEGLAIDLWPSSRAIESFHNFCMRRLEEWGCWMEDPAYTSTWAHLQLRPVGKSQRVFKP